MTPLFKTLSNSPQGECLVSWRVDGSGKERTLQAKSFLSPWERVANGLFQIVSQEECFLPLTVLDSNGPLRNEPTSTLYFKAHQLQKEFDIDLTTLAESASSGRLSRIVAERMEEIQKSTSPFSDRELYDSGLTFGNYTAICQKLSDFQEPWEKLYFRTQDLKISTSKKGFFRDYLIKIRSTPAGVRIQTGFAYAEGVSKAVFFTPNLITGKIDVLSRENFHRIQPDQNVGRQIEAELLMALKNREGIVDCREITDKSKTKTPLDISLQRTVRCYVFESCEGGTLATAFKSLTQREKLYLFKDFLMGLSHIHRLGYLHFDLHAGNMLLKRTTERLVGKLIDFANARHQSQIQDPDYFLHSMVQNKFWTAHWSAFSPEMQLYLQRCKGNVLDARFPNYPLTTKSDIWQIGLILAILHYQIDMEWIGFWPYQHTLPSFLKFFFTIFPYRDDFRNLTVENTAFCVDSMLQESVPHVNPDSFEFLLWSMLHPNPDKRPDAGECVVFLHKIIENLK